MKQPVIFLMGPTGAGKTDLAVELASRLPCDIISVDSAMVYRDMNIGTAKPDAALRARAPHRLIDFLDPAEAYSAARFRDDACREVAEIHTRGRIPLLVGGTMLYFHALRAGLSHLPSAEVEVRARITAEARSIGWPLLHARLAASDPASAARIHPNDAQRIQRALEILELTGETPSALYEAEKPESPWIEYTLVLAPRERANLHERLVQRFNNMMTQGFLVEVQRLHARGDLNLDKPALRAVGYRQLWQYLDGDWNLDEAVTRGIAATRQLAKRQMTWLKREAAAVWLETGAPALATRAAEQLASLGLRV